MKQVRFAITTILFSLSGVAAIYGAMMFKEIFEEYRDNSDAFYWKMSGFATLASLSLAAIGSILLSKRFEPWLWVPILAAGFALAQLATEWFDSVVLPASLLLMAVCAVVTWLLVRSRTNGGVFKI